LGREKLGFLVRGGVTQLFQLPAQSREFRIVAIGLLRQRGAL
jgi:hypothetical protein